MNKNISIHIATYNHKDYIRKSLDSAINQKLNTDFEIVIGDDYSTDGTREILIEYKEKYPDIITLNLQASKGVGMPGHINFVSTLEKCKGKYIAFLDGDDYWTNENKLQKQYDFMESNSDFVMCHHDCSSEKAEGIALKRNYNAKHSVSGFYDACQITFPFFSSAFVKKSVIDEFNLRQWLSDMIMGDFPFWVLVTSRGNAYYMNEEMAYYRRLANSYSAGFKYSEYIDSRIIFFRKLLKSNEVPDKKFVHRILSKYYFESSAYYLSDKRIKSSFKNLIFGIANLFSGIGKSKRKIVWNERLKLSSVFSRFFYGIVSLIKGKKPINGRNRI